MSLLKTDSIEGQESLESLGVAILGQNPKKNHKAMADRGVQQGKDLEILMPERLCFLSPVFSLNYNMLD